jgi:hypothetical protein
MHVEIEIGAVEMRLKSTQGMRPAFATSRELGLGVSMFVSLRGNDGRSRISPSLSRLRWGRFWHACCVVGAAAHIARLHFSGDHLESVGSLSGGTSWSALVYYTRRDSQFALKRLPLSGVFMYAD